VAGGTASSGEVQGGANGDDDIICVVCKSGKESAAMGPILLCDVCVLVFFDVTISSMYSSTTQPVSCATHGAHTALHTAPVFISPTLTDLLLVPRHHGS
jgi:hypothetical protein